MIASLVLLLVPPINGKYLLFFVLAFVGIIGLLQGKDNFSVRYARNGLHENKAETRTLPVDTETERELDLKKSQKIIFRSVIGSIVITAVAYNTLEQATLFSLIISSWSLFDRITILVQTVSAFALLYIGYNQYRLHKREVEKSSFKEIGAEREDREFEIQYDHQLDGIYEGRYRLFFENMGPGDAKDVKVTELKIIGWVDSKIMKETVRIHNWTKIGHIPKGTIENVAVPRIKREDGEFLPVHSIEISMEAKGTTERLCFKIHESPTQLSVD